MVKTRFLLMVELTVDSGGLAGLVSCSCPTMLWDDGQLWCAWLLPHLDLLTVADPVPLTQRSPDCLL